MARSLARRAAMQLLYERLSGGEADQESLDMVYEQLSEEGEKPQRVNPTREDREYIDDVLQGVQNHQQELDDKIASHSTGEWTMGRVPHVDLSILRLAAYEMFHRSDVPDPLNDRRKVISAADAVGDVVTAARVGPAGVAFLVT